MRYNLSEICDVIRDRRTIGPQNYTSRKVHREIIEKLLENARWAPTHRMTQPWRFKVFMEEGREKLSQLLGETYKAATSEEDFEQSKYEKLTQRPLQASMVMTICMKRSQRVPEEEEIASVAAAVQNMALTATAYGLGSFWSTPDVVYTEVMSQALELEEGERCLGLFYLGYPAIDWPKSQRKPVEYFTEWIMEA